MEAPNPEQTHFMLEHLGKILIATAGILLGMVKILKGSKADKAAVACAVIKDEPVLQADLLRCKIDVKETIDSKFEKFTARNEANLARMERTILREIKSINRRVDYCQSHNCSD